MLPSCRTISPIYSCPITQVPAPPAPTLEPLDWVLEDNLYYIDEQNFKKYASNLEKLVNYASELEAQNTYYVELIESCKE